MERVIPTWVECGVAGLALPGQSESGDMPAIAYFPGGLLAAAVDGLGHGDEAAAAAKIAISTLESNPGEPVIELVRRCHVNLRGTRGVVMSLASFRVTHNLMTWLGVGNTEGVLLRFDASLTPDRESLLLRAGVVGVQLPALQAAVLPIARGDTLILCTDGIRSPFDQQIRFCEAPQQIADKILSQNGKGTDDALVLVARYFGDRQ